MAPTEARYDTIGATYGRHRRADPRIAAAIRLGLRGARTVIDVGSGAGSYEPTGCRVAAVEPSRRMIEQRPPEAAPALQGVAEHLPFADGAFDAALAVLTHHHWSDAVAGLRELARVSARQVVLTWDPAVFARFWLVEEYLPEIAAAEASLATLETVRQVLLVDEVLAVPVPRDCTDGFCGAYWRRPKAYLDPDVRLAISTFSSVPAAAVERALVRLAADLDDGTWAARHRDLTGRSELDLGYRLVMAAGAR